MKELLAKLEQNGLTLGCVESMTGGRFASEVTSVAGASKVFKGGVITYHTSEKINLLGIDSKLIEENGVVSRVVAEEMARRGRELLNVDVCISITGNAGPTCEPGGEPVGRVYVGLSTKDKTISEKLSLLGNREKNRKDTVRFIEQYILKSLFEK